MPFGDLRKRVTPWARHLKRRRRFLTRGALGRLVEGLLEDVLGLLERLDLLRARSFAVLVRRVTVDAGVLQVRLVLHGGLELLHVVLEIIGLADELLTLALLARLLHFGVLLLLRDGDLRIRQPLIILILLLRLVGLGVGLHQGEVLRDALEHADDTGALRATLVRRLEELWIRLGQLSLPRRSFDAAHIRFHLVELIGLLLDHASALVELLEDSDGLADCSLRILGVLNRCHVLGLLCLPLLSFVFDLRLHGRNSCHVLLDLHREIKENMAAVATMQTEIEDETEERQAEKAENMATIKDAQDAQTAVSQAIAVLEEFYKGTGMIEKEDWELNQMKAHVRRIKAPPGETEMPEPNPELFESPYKGSSEGSGVIGMLEGIAENFALMETNAKADETEQSDE